MNPREALLVDINIAMLDMLKYIISCYSELKQNEKVIEMHKQIVDKMDRYELLLAAEKENEKYFSDLRHNPDFHLGLGDIRLTRAMQDEIIAKLLTSSEIELILLCLDLTKKHLQDQKENIGGLLIGFTKIDAICNNIDYLKDKLKWTQKKN